MGGSLDVFLDDDPGGFAWQQNRKAHRRNTDVRHI
jgi:hypothetical protein